MSKVSYPQQLPEDANLIKHVSIGQTRNGKDEFITPVTIWEVDKATGEHVPAGEAVEVKAPRVRLDAEAQTALDEVKTELELVKTELQTIKTNQLSGDQKVSLFGTIMEHFGATVANRPPANTVVVGATYMAVKTQEVWQSDGTDWVVM